MQAHWLDVHNYNELFVSLTLANTKDMVIDHSTFNFAYVDDTYLCLCLSGKLC